jgi:hypothetical protein
MTGGLRTGLAAGVCISLESGRSETGALDVLRFRTSVATTCSPLPLLANVELESLTLCGMLELNMVTAEEKEK